MSTYQDSLARLAEPYDLLTKEVSLREVESIKRMPEGPTSLLMTVRIPRREFRDYLVSATRYATKTSDQRRFLSDQIAQSGADRATDLQEFIHRADPEAKLKTLPNLHQVICETNSPRQLVQKLDPKRMNNWVASVLPDLPLGSPPDPPPSSATVATAANMASIPWWIEMTGLADLHRAGHIGSGQIGVVIDSGLRLGLPTLPNTKFLGYCEIDPPGIARDAPIAMARDPLGHATRIIHLIAADQGNPEFPRGAAPGSQLLVARVLDERGEALLTHLASAINWAVEQTKIHRVRVANLSLEVYSPVPGNVLATPSIIERIFKPVLQRFVRGPIPSIDPAQMPDLLRFLKFVLQILIERDVQPILAIGNRGSRIRSEIADSGLSVGAIKQDRQSCIFSGKNPHILAPGLQVDCVHHQLTNGNPGVEPHSGTSISVAIVTGAFLVLGGAFPRFSSEIIREAIVQTSNRVSGNPDHPGILDVQAAHAYLSQLK